MHSATQFIAQRGTQAARTKPRWQPYNSIPSSANISNPPSSIYPNSVSSPIPTQIPKDRENSKNKFAAGLVGRSISYMCLISYLFHSLRSSRQNIIRSMAYPGHSGCFFATTNPFYNCRYQGAFSEEGTIVTSDFRIQPIHTTVINNNNFTNRHHLHHSYLFAPRKRLGSSSYQIFRARST